MGAFLNEASQAKEGIEPSVFPQHVPVYTGHYHKPHVVKGTRIEYVGSPYQVSAGECEQAKRFLVLDKQWQVSHWLVPALLFSQFTRTRFPKFTVYFGIAEN